MLALLHAEKKTDVYGTVPGMPHFLPHVSGISQETFLQVILQPEPHSYFTICNAPFGQKTQLD